MPSGAEPKIREAIDIALKHQAQGRLRAPRGNIYRRVLRVEPENPDALHFLGVIAHKIGRPDLAMELLARSIAADPDRVGFRLNLGSLHLKRQQVDEAIACYRDAITLDPASASAYAHLAGALARQGKLEEANHAYARATELKGIPSAVRPQPGPAGVVTTQPPAFPAALPEPGDSQVELESPEMPELLDEPWQETGPTMEVEALPTSESATEVAALGPGLLAGSSPAVVPDVGTSAAVNIPTSDETGILNAVRPQPGPAGVTTQPPASPPALPGPGDSQVELESPEMPELLDEPSQETDPTMDVEAVPTSESATEVAALGPGLLAGSTIIPPTSDEAGPVPSSLNSRPVFPESDAEEASTDAMDFMAPSPALPWSTEGGSQMVPEQAAFSPDSEEPDLEVASNLEEQSIEIAPDRAEEISERPLDLAANADVLLNPQSAPEMLPAEELAAAADDLILLEAVAEPAPEAQDLPVQLGEAGPLPELPAVLAHEPPISVEPIEPVPAYEVDIVEQPAVPAADEVVLSGPIEFVIPVEPEAGHVEQELLPVPEVIPPGSIDFVIPVEPEGGHPSASGGSIAHAAMAGLALQYAWALHFAAAHPIPVPAGGIFGVADEEPPPDQELFALLPLPDPDPVEPAQAAEAETLGEDAEGPFELDDDAPLIEALEAVSLGELVEASEIVSPDSSVPAEPAKLDSNDDADPDRTGAPVAAESSGGDFEFEEPPTVDLVQVLDDAPAAPGIEDATLANEPVATVYLQVPQENDAVEGSPEHVAADEPVIARWPGDEVPAQFTAEESAVPIAEAIEPGAAPAAPADGATDVGVAIEVYVRPGLLGEAHAQVLYGGFEPSVDGAGVVSAPAVDRLAETLPLPGMPGLRSIRAPNVPAPAAGRGRPPSAESLRRRAAALIGFRRLDEAVQLLNQALTLRPKFAEAHRDLGGAKLRQGNLEGAIASLQRALQLRPGFAEAWGSLGDAYQLEGKISQAIRCYRRLLEIAPRAAKVHSNMLLSMNYDPRFSAEEVFHEHLLWAERHADPHFRDIQAHANDRTPGRRLMIGYVSPDFRRHSVNYFAEPVLAGHYRRDFHVTCYSDVIRPDGVTRGLAGLSDDFRDTHSMNDEQLAAQVRADRIDILVDLSGHTGNNRLGTFARKPAPIQVTYLGYPNTTGLSTMDYRITDALADPPGQTERLHSEQLVRLPDTFLCYQPPEGSPDVGPLPCLKAGYVTFGCFNILAKITDEVMALWARILQELPNSRLVLKGRSNALSAENRRQHVRNIFVNHGISPDRLELLGKEPSYSQHLTHYRRLDIVLDPFPYNGTTTTCEALWMGLPVVTLAGDRHVSRVGVSILSNLGLPELIAATPEQYVRIATSLADSPKDLSRLRSTLRDRMHRSPLTDSVRLTRALETEYRNMWAHWCQSEHGAPAPRDTLSLTDG